VLICWLPQKQALHAQPPRLLPGVKFPLLGHEIERCALVNAMLSPFRHAGIKLAVIG
jgi:hypothetical protein